MSGIAGIYYVDGRPVERTDIQQMVDSIAHRGPDGCGVWTDGSVGFGHRMLWTTPESLHEKLPLTNKTGDLTITADARIDNRDELIPALSFNGRPRETIADSEIILAAYEKWGEKCPEKLLGDFALAIWDKRKQTIFCARDPIGIKPFYYYFKKGKFRWSSEPKAIFEDGTVPKEPNLQLICLYLLNRFDEREETLYKDVYRLPSSHSMVIENGHIRKDQYWDIDPNYSIRYKTDAEYAEHFLNLFKEAVRVRLRSHGPAGAFLSGGLDSSSIVCTAQLLHKENSIPNNGFETFSIVFDTFPCDERPYINEVVHKWNINANYFKYEDYFASVDFEETKKYPDVSYGPTLFFLDPALRNAQQKGKRVMLNGVGGDDLFAVDFDHLTDLMVRGNIRKLLMQLKCDSSLCSCSRYSLFLNYCLKPLIPRPIKIPLKQILRPFRRNGIPSWINVEDIRMKGVNDRIKTVVLPKKFLTRSQQRIYQFLFYGRNTNMVLDALDRFFAHFGIESRYPFFDPRVVKFTIGLPEDQRWCKERTKAVLREGIKGILPELIRNRKDKAEFSPIIDQELRQRQVGKLYQIIGSSRLAVDGLIHANRLNQLLENYCHGATENNVRNDLEAILGLELWYRSQWEP
jgi:asparagine synthase (glutamine-hydrolysing)